MISFKFQVGHVLSEHVQRMSSFNEQNTGVNKLKPLNLSYTVISQDGMRQNILTGSSIQMLCQKLFTSENLLFLENLLYIYIYIYVCVCVCVCEK